VLFFIVVTNLKVKPFCLLLNCTVFGGAYNIGIELICRYDRDKAREEEFRMLRKYVREGSLQDLWPIFHKVEGDIKSIFEYITSDNQVEEKVSVTHTVYYKLTFILYLI
jgi:hypothetical protein